jgi:hypothetical protein
MKRMEIVNTMSQTDNGNIRYISRRPSRLPAVPGASGEYPNPRPVAIR